jgi:Tfp pilus assembly protein PilO
MNRTLLSVILLIISIAAFFWWVNPRYENAKILSAQLSSSNSALASAKELESLRASLVDKENSFKQEDLAKLQKLLPDNVDNIRLFLNIQGVAARYGTSIQDISVAGQDQKTTGTQAIGPSDKQYNQMTLSFSISTSYENLGLFIKDLEKSLRIVEIKSLSFVADNKNPNHYKVAIGINTFLLGSTVTTTSLQ